MQDPLQRLAGDRDLQGVATWEPRSVADRLLVRLHGLLGGAARLAVLGALVALILAEIALFGLGLLFEPLIALFTALSVVPAALIAVYVYQSGSELVAHEPLRTVAVTFVLGAAFVAVPLLVNTVARPVFVGAHPLGLYAFYLVVVAPIEEVTKLAAVWFHAYGSDVFDSVVDGAVYGAAAGLGFATAENAVYLAQSVFGIGLVEGTITRAAAAPLHVLLTAVSGYYLGLAKFNEGYRGPLVLKGLLIATVTHGLYNVGLATVAPASIASLDATPAMTPVDRASAAVVVLGINGVLAIYLIGKIRRYGVLLADAEGRP